MCTQCEALRVNGVLCHENGCPEAWRDYTRECRECGTTFKPEEKHQVFCSPCCNAAYYGQECCCNFCQEYRRGEEE